MYLPDYTKLYVQKVKTTTMKNDKADKIVNFRCNSDLWDRFCDFAKNEHGTTASALLKDLMIRAMDNHALVGNDAIEESIRDGAIGAAIDKHYRQVVAYINDIASRLNEVEKVVNTDVTTGDVNTDVNIDVDTDDVNTDVKTDVTIDDVNTDVNTDVTTDVDTDDVNTDVKTDVTTDDVNTNVKTDVTTDDVKTDVNTDVLARLGLADVAKGQLYNASFLADRGIFEELDKNRLLIEKMGIFYKPNDIATVNGVLRKFGYKPRLTTKKKQKYYTTSAV